MKRQIFQFHRGGCSCCPGHDNYPGESYKNRRSKKARVKGKKIEHKYARTLLKRDLNKELEDEQVYL